MIPKALADFTLPSIGFRAADTSSTANAWEQATTLITQIIQMLLFVAGALAVIYLIYSGILYITAAGNPDNAKKGQQGIMNALIGIVIIVLSYFLVTTVASVVQKGTV